MVSSGKILAVYSDRRTYDVLLDDQRTVDATIIETGTDFTLLRHNRVACVFMKGVGWKIIGKMRTPAVRTEKEEQQKTVAERIAEEQDWLNSIISGRDLETAVSYREEGEDPLLEGEVALKSLINRSSVSIFNDGSIIARITDALLFLISKMKRTALLSVRRLILRIIPGIKIELGVKEDGESQNPDTTVKPKVTAVVALSSDPDKPEEADFILEAGGLNPNTVQYNESLKTREQTLVRGLKFLLKNFSIAEVDNDKGEIRLTYLQSAEKRDPLGNPFQLRINEDEVVISWGSQFISFTDKGLMIKADRIGLAGPIDMWDPAAVQGFSHQTGFPDPLQPDPVTIEWYAQGTPPGIRIAKSVYFGQSKEPAILDGFIESRYKADLDQIWQHTHQAGPIATSPPLTSPVMQALFVAGTVDPIKALWLSLVQISV